jgi:hypothetical protein
MGHRLQAVNPDSRRAPATTDDEMLSVDDCVRLLRRAVPGLAVAQDNDRVLHAVARARLRSAKTVRYAYLLPGDGRVALRLYVADTLTQARIFYGDSVRVAGLLSLRERGWQLRPDFHFGFVERGFINTESALDAARYVTYWTTHIAGLGPFERADWERELRRLIEDGIFDAADEAQFHRVFTSTARSSAVPRPGIRLSRDWDITQAHAAEFCLTVRAALAEALSALRERATCDALTTDHLAPGPIPARDAVEYPDIRYVVSPVHVDGTLTGGKPRLRHYPDCGHFGWPDGVRLGTPELATDEQMRSLRACKSCISSRSGRAGNTRPSAREARAGRLCPTCHQTLPLTGRCDNCET